MNSLRHITLGCCILCTVGGVFRLFWPENSFKPVINAVLALYIIASALQMFRNTNWHNLADLLQGTSGTGVEIPDYSAYGQELVQNSSADAVREVLRRASIEAAVSMQDGICVITPVHASDTPAIKSLLEVNGGILPYRITTGGDAP